jgi:hypothetical protein
MALLDKLKGTRLGPIGVLALALALPACGGGSTPAAERPETSATSDPEAGTAVGPEASSATGTEAGSNDSGDYCRLISQAEAEQVLGVAVEAGVPSSGEGVAGPDVGGCKYLGTAVDPSTSSKGIVQVAVLGTELTRAQYDELAGEGAADASAQPVPGLGETAFYLPGATIFWFDAGLAMFVQVVKADRTPVTVAEITALAQTALERAGGLR